MASKKIIAVWGSPGSGTTLTSIKVARELANRKKNVVLILSDSETPMVPVLAPSVRNAKSIGNLLSLPTISPTDVFEHLIPTQKTISLLGYLKDENELTWPEYDEERAKELLGFLRETADYVLVDCSHHLLTNTMTAVALENADAVLCVVNADPKSLSYIKSQQPILNNSKFNSDRQVNIMNNFYANQDRQSYEGAFGMKTSYSLPHLSSLRAQYWEGRLLEPVTGREGKLYEPIIKSIVEEEIMIA
jgi:ATPases involved in chromosome partitioning